jgi:hypothetical protein
MSNPNVRLASLLTVAAVCALVAVIRAGDQTSSSRPAAATAPRPATLPPVVQTCPMHPDIVEDKAGSCPLCKMALVPVRLEAAWSCPVHAAIVRDAKGSCPICRRELVQMTMALTWTCRNRPDIDVLEPGRCPDGSAMIAKRTLRPHGNHNPQHGGQFFMAPDNTHHLEGTLPSSRLFRLYLYDDYARPLPATRLKAIQGRVEIGGQAVPLVASASGSHLQGRLTSGSLPAKLTARIRIKPDAPEYRFDFTFAAITKDPSNRPVTTPSNGAASKPASPAGPSATALPLPVASEDGSVDPALIKVPIPSTLPEILSQLAVRDRQVRELIDRGNLAAVFVPAFQARDLALALEGHLNEVPSARRDAAAAAIRELVQAAWLLDAFGDLGNAGNVRSAYVPFHDAAGRIATAYAGNR